MQDEGKESQGQQLRGGSHLDDSRRPVPPDPEQARLEDLLGLPALVLLIVQPLEVHLVEALGQRLELLYQLLVLLVGL